MLSSATNDNFSDRGQRTETHKKGAHLGGHTEIVGCSHQLSYLAWRAADELTVSMIQSLSRPCRGSGKCEKSTNVSMLIHHTQRKGGHFGTLPLPLSSPHSSSANTTDAFPLRSINEDLLALHSSPPSPVQPPPFSPPRIRFPPTPIAWPLTLETVRSDLHFQLPPQRRRWQPACAEHRRGTLRHQAG